MKYNGFILLTHCVRDYPFLTCQSRTIFIVPLKFYKQRQVFSTSFVIFLSFLEQQRKETDNNMPENGKKAKKRKVRKKRKWYAQNVSIMRNFSLEDLSLCVCFCLLFLRWLLRDFRKLLLSICGILWGLFKPYFSPFIIALLLSSFKRNVLYIN